LTTDAGLIFSEYKETSFMEYNDMEIDIEPPTGDFFAKIKLIISNETRVYERSYLKLLDVIANVGGFIGLVQVIIEFIFSFYLDNEYSIYIYKKIYSLEIDNDNISEQKQSINHIIDKNNNSNKNNSNNFNNFNHNEKNEIIDKNEKGIKDIPRL